MFGKLRNEPIGSHTKDDFRKLLESQGFLCFYCGIPICENSKDQNCEATEDHLVPQSRGGVDFIWNIVGACLQCNQLKGSMLPGQFLQHRWSIAQLVDPRAQKRTSIPFSKGRVLPVNEPETDDDGNLITSHLEVDVTTGSVVRYLADAKKMEPNAEDRRRKELRDQVNTIMRVRQEAAGQMQLEFVKPKPVTAALCETEAQTMLVEKGLAIFSAIRRRQA